MDVGHTGQMIEALLVAILGTAVGSLLARESSALLRQLNRALLDRRLRRLPRHLSADARDRRSQEIEADSEAYSERPIAGLVVAMFEARKGKRLRVLGPYAPSSGTRCE